MSTHCWPPTAGPMLLVNSVLVRVRGAATPRSCGFWMRSSCGVCRMPTRRVLPTAASGASISRDSILLASALALSRPQRAPCVDSALCLTRVSAFPGVAQRAAKVRGTGNGIEFGKADETAYSKKRQRMLPLCKKLVDGRRLELPTSALRTRGRPSVWRRLFVVSCSRVSAA
jgi:hypothetical protein